MDLANIWDLESRNHEYDLDNDAEFNKVFWNITLLCEKLEISYDELYKMQKQINDIQLKWNVIKSITFSDLDDTLFSRLPQLEMDIFAKNRWKAWNLVIDSMWINNFFARFYKPEMLVDDVAKKTDVILTAWEIHIQEWKIQSIWLYDKETIIVPKHSLKPKTMLYYLLYDLEVIPEEIIFNDDRVRELSESFKLMSYFLWNKIKLKEVELDEDHPNIVKNTNTIAYNKWNQYFNLWDLNL